MSELDDYDYEFPPELIAQHPLTERSDARLLVVDRRTRTFDHRHVRDLPQLLDPRDALVVNESRVVPARLVGRRAATQGRWEGLFLSAEATGDWRLLGHTRGKIQPGEWITLWDHEGRDALRVQLLERQAGGVWLARPEQAEPWHQCLERVGRTPLPHYIRDGRMVESDRERYQTVFARAPGSVAAPTAGLHFSSKLLQRLSERGVSLAKVTLHVGLGTFRPIAAERLADHLMHREWGQIDPAEVERLHAVRAQGGRVIAVGTTSVRVLETAAADGSLAPWSGETELFIRPPYAFRAVDALLTNFHLPRSTLLVLVATFADRELILRAYRSAIAEGYRLFSYGDAMLIL